MKRLESPVGDAEEGEEEERVAVVRAQSFCMHA